MIKVSAEINIEFTKVADKFFTKHQTIYKKFIDNITSYYYHQNNNIDIKAMKSYKNLYRMRINNYRVIYKLINGEITIISVLAAGTRGQIYNKF